MRTWLGLLLLSACASSPAPPKVDVGWAPLETEAWTLAAGGETNPTTDFAAPRDYTITAIRAIAPLGTHHVGLLGAGVAHNLMYTSPPGSGAFLFPDGVGLRIRQGDAMTLEAHLVNATTHALDGVSGLEIQEATASTLHEANVLTPANLSFTLPPGPSQQLAHCTLTYDQTVFAVAPHMHALGTHLKTTLIQGGAAGASATVLFDEDFDFNNQVYRLIDAVQAHAGDRVEVECTFDNTTGHAVSWGGTAAHEMCQTMLYRYPLGDGNFCTN